VANTPLEPKEKHPSTPSDQETTKSQSKRASGYINSAVSFAKHDALMHDVVKEMIDHKISSVLVEDDKENIIGIITERDIVRKFTLLDVEDKLDRTVSTIMSRPVEFVQVKDVHKQIIKLHLEKRIRHFPVLSAKEARKENLIGIVSITDIARHYMIQETSRASNIDSSSSGGLERASVSKPRVGVLASNRSMVNTYIEIFKGLGFLVQEVTDIHKFAVSADATQRALVLDLDGYSDQQVHEILPVAVKSNVFLLLTTSKPGLLPVFKRYLNASHQEIAMKPLDMSYISWLLQKRQATR
jgi:CBS domain-containing protein